MIGTEVSYTAITTGQITKGWVYADHGDTLTLWWETGAWQTISRKGLRLYLREV